jgi:hypothetical protein
MSVNLETTVEGIKDGWYLALDDSEFLPLDAPEGFVAMEEPPTKEAETIEKQKGLRSKSVNSSATNPAPVGNGPSVNAPTTITRSSPVSHGSNSKPVYVRGYYRNDGTYVRSHTRAAPGMGTHRRH